MIRIVRFVENAVEWRKMLAGKLQKCAGSEPGRIGIGAGSDWRTGHGDSNWIGTCHGRRLGEKEGRLLGVGVGKGIGSGWSIGSDTETNES